MLHCHGEHVEHDQNHYAQLKLGTHCHIVEETLDLVLLPNKKAILSDLILRCTHRLV